MLGVAQNLPHPTRQTEMSEAEYYKYRRHKIEFLICTSEEDGDSREARYRVESVGLI